MEGGGAPGCIVSDCLKSQPQAPPSHSIFSHPASEAGMLALPRYAQLFHFCRRCSTTRASTSAHAVNALIVILGRAPGIADPSASVRPDAPAPQPGSHPKAQISTHAFRPETTLLSQAFLKDSIYSWQPMLVGPNARHEAPEVGHKRTRFSIKFKHRPRGLLTAMPPAPRRCLS